MSAPYSDLMREISREEYEADLKANPSKASSAGFARL